MNLALNKKPLVIKLAPNRFVGRGRYHGSLSAEDIQLLDLENTEWYFMNKGCQPDGLNQQISINNTVGDGLLRIIAKISTHQ